jgi:hypothetical protein
MTMEKIFAQLYFYVAAKLIDVKTKCYKDRRGLEQEEVGALLLVIRDYVSECLRR